MIPDGGSQVQGNTLRHTFQNSHGLFMQDSFRATPRLTLNYGVRWDYFGVTGEKNWPVLHGFDPPAAGSNVPGRPALRQGLQQLCSPRGFRLRRNRQGQDRDSRRMGIVLRRILAGYLPRPPALELRASVRARRIRG